MAWAIVCPMAAIHHLRKRLEAPPAVPEVTGALVRTLRLPGDIEPWLQLRARASSDLEPRPRSWLEGDFRREMLEKPWFHRDSSWVAHAPGASEEFWGSITLALREGVESTVPVVHWLLVDPSHRRRGIGRLLLAHLELAVWNRGIREIALETHGAWRSAVAFYRANGYGT